MINYNENLQIALEKLNIAEDRRKNEYRKIKNIIIEMLKENCVDYMINAEITTDKIRYTLYGDGNRDYLLSSIMDLENGIEINEFFVVFSLSESEQRFIKSYIENRKIYFETNVTETGIQHKEIKPVDVDKELLDD